MRDSSCALGTGGQTCALPIYYRLGLPKTVGLALAVEADRDAHRHVGERLAVRGGADHALRELDAAAADGEVGEIVGDVLPMGGAGEEKAGEAHRLDDGSSEERRVG